MIPYLSESIKQNFNDIQDTRAKTEHIEQMIDQLYQQFLKRERSHHTPHTTKPHNNHSVLSRWRVIGVAVFATVLMTLVGVALFISLSPSNPSKSPVSPSEPIPIDNYSVDFDKSFRIIFEELYMSTNKKQILQCLQNIKEKHANLETKLNTRITTESTTIPSHHANERKVTNITPSTVQENLQEQEEDHDDYSEDEIEEDADDISKQQPSPPLGISRILTLVIHVYALPLFLFFAILKKYAPK